MTRAVLDEIARLSVTERIQLAEDIWDTIALQQEPVPLTADQIAEIERRLSAHWADPATALAWENVAARLRTLL